MKGQGNPKGHLLWSTHVSSLILQTATEADHQMLNDRNEIDPAKYAITLFDS